MSFGQIENGVERVAGMLGEVIALGQLDHIEPLVQQKVDITPREELRHVGTAFRVELHISERSYYERSLIMRPSSANVKYV